ncbi:LON peptidase substrate-binding domain-containing protein [Ferrimonas sp. YFM]|uniref:LON peptidase substrate-binding domain-containing protein n=1 Tax=Ferrimonas sp. YFM TaxID=3028878 RepID=UPI00257278D3|nr:LON peptidase substrate-binding domain-containing protein [Ferrimonas sp. YFM]BDY03694.1 ATP-dependent protease [Ferrimonas sp. YFM]
MRLPLFPLNAHVFPEGRLALRIFEARYLRMVRERAGHEPCFAMGMLEKTADGSSRVLGVVTLVKMVDFDQLDDGLLGITVEGVSLARVDETESDEDGLRWAKCIPFDLWPEEAPGEDPRIQQALARLFSEYPEIGGLYSQPGLDSLTWSLQRWLELLPIEASAKATLLTQPSSAMAVSLIHSILDKSDP